jgi:TatD DNase family protein
MWIDTHCHLDASAFDVDRNGVVQRAQLAGVQMMVLPAVHSANFQTVRELAHRHQLVYALGIHPLFVNQATEHDLTLLDSELQAHQHDPRLVAVGEIGLDNFVPGLDQPKDEHFFVQQLKLAQAFKLPVIIHVRRSADALLKHLRRHAVQGIAHAFNGSAQQANAFCELGFKLGFGGAMTFERAQQIRRLAQTLPADALVMETDAPDMPPQWLYQTVAQRVQGLMPPRNEPAQLPRMAQTLAHLRGWSSSQTAQTCAANACVALPRLGALLRGVVSENGK